MKALIVILGISAVVFSLAKPIALQFTAESDFSRRRNVWFALTVTAFVSPNFWLYALVAAPLFYWAGKKDSNPIAMYLLLLHVIPPIPVDIPVSGFELFPLDNYRLLSFCVLIPVVVRLRGSKSTFRSGFTVMDALLLGYGLLQIAIFIPPDLPNHVILSDSPTNVLRRAFLFFIDTYVLYYVVSRACSTRRSIVESLAAFCLAGALMAAVALFEFSRHWLLYADMAASWANNPLAAFYLLRGDVLRAKVTSGHPLTLGYLLAIAFGFWLYLQFQLKHMSSASPGPQVPIGRLRVIGYPLVIASAFFLYIKSFLENRRNLVAVSLFWLGLLAAYSRGPWIGALIIYFAFVALGRRAFSGLLQASAILAVLGGAIALSPIGKKVISTLPFFGGTVETASIDYRQRLAHRTWELIQANPYFGDQLAWTKMEDLRQGQGIIDLVNTYAEIALFYGACGLFLFLGVMLVGLLKTYRLARALRTSDADLALLGGCLTACLLGTLFMMASNSLGLGLEKMYYVLAGLAAAYIYVGKLRIAN